MYFLYVLSWFTFGWISSRIAKKQGRNPAVWFALGVFLGLISLILLYFLPKRAAVKPETAPISAPKPEEISMLPPEKLWYYLDKEKAQFGPMSFYALQEAWDDDKITASTYVWNEDMENWARLESLSDLHSRIIRRTPQS